jgi:hypothetical protein
VEDSNNKNKTKALLLELITYQTELKAIDTQNISSESLLTTMEEFYRGYDKIKVLLQSMEQVMNDSITSV